MLIEDAEEIRKTVWLPRKIFLDEVIHEKGQKKKGGQEFKIQGSKMCFN